MKDCPPDAIHRSPGGEVYITDACIGCGNCEKNCPYGVIQMAPLDGKRGIQSLWAWLFLTGLGRSQEPGAKAKPDAGKGRRPGKGQAGRVKKAVKCDMCRDISPARPACAPARPALLVEVLHGDRVAGAHQHVAAVLQQGIHRHHEEPGAGADHHQQRHGQPQAADQHHQRHQQAHRDAQRNHAHRSAQRDSARGHDGADGDADGDHALKFGRLRQSHAERTVGPVDHDELQRRAGAPEKRGDGE
jgi:Fe-S-cluster-containing hydrogenase component 2